LKKVIYVLAVISLLTGLIAGCQSSQIEKELPDKEVISQKLSIFLEANGVKVKQVSIGPVFYHEPAFISLPLTNWEDETAHVQFIPPEYQREAVVKQILVINYLTYSFFFEGEGKALSSTLERIQVEAVKPNGERIASTKYGPSTLSVCLAELKAGDLPGVAIKLTKERQITPLIKLGPVSQSTLKPGSESAGIKLLIFLSPQYAKNQEVTQAIERYGKAVKADIGWDIELILLTPSSNTVGNIREIIKKYYSSCRVYAAIMVGEDIATALNADTDRMEAPSIVPWAELNEPIVFHQPLPPAYPNCVYYWLPPEINKEELDSFFQEPGEINITPGSVPEVCIALVYPTAERPYSEKATQVISVFDKFSSNRNIDYGEDILFLHDPEFSPISRYPEVFKKRWSQLGKVKLMTNRPEISDLEGKRFKLIGCEGHGTPTGTTLFGTYQLEKVKVPMAIFGGCYTSGWYSRKGEDDNRLNPSKMNRPYGWIGEQIFLHQDVRVIVAGTSPFQRSECSLYGDYCESFAWYAPDYLAKGKTIAEAWLDATRIRGYGPDDQIVYGDPTFHYK